MKVGDRVLDEASEEVMIVTEVVEGDRTLWLRSEDDGGQHLRGTWEVVSLTDIEELA